MAEAGVTTASGQGAPRLAAAAKAKPAAGARPRWVGLRRAASQTARRRMCVVRSHRVWGAPFWRLHEANAFPKVPCTCFPPAAWPEPFPLPSLSVRQPPQAGQTAACVPWAVPRLRPRCPLSLSWAPPCLLANSYSAVRTRARGASPAAVLTSLHSASLPPTSCLVVTMLRPLLTASCSPARPLPPASRCRR